MSINGNGANYAPLKQILSDSESEDDHKEAFMKNTDSNLDFNSGLHSSKNYSISDMDDFNTNVNTLGSTMDNVSILHSESSKNLSIQKQCGIFFSTVFCFVTIIVFLWGIPCKDITICEKSDWNNVVDWEFPYDEIELYGKGQVVNGTQPRASNMIFIYRGNLMKKNVNPNDNVNGVLQIVGTTGKIGWYTRESRIPMYIHCHLLDVNNDKMKDCIVVGTEGLLSTLNPISGTYYWYIHKEGNFINNITNIDFPVLIKDVDKDRVDDLLTVATVLPNTNHNSLLLISGATGNIISDYVTLNDCTSVKLTPEAEMVTYICKNNTKEAIRVVTYPLIMNVNETTKNHSRNIEPVNPKKNNTSRTDNGRYVYNFKVNKFILENTGECPETCKVNLKAIFEKDRRINITWEYSANHVFAMKPVSFSMAKGLGGFLIKLRQWNTAQLGMGSHKIDEIRYNVQNQSPKNQYDIFYFKPSINTASIGPYIKYTNYTAYHVSERIVLVAFDKDQMHHVNISQTDIVQFCIRDSKDDLSMPKCQPDLDDQNTLIVGDLNGDKSHEIITYYTTFVGPRVLGKKSNNHNTWHLTSIVKVIRLESELDKLFVKVDD